MFYITGDTHNEQARIMELYTRLGASNWGVHDYHIVCGDWGFLWKNNADEQQFLDDMARASFTFLFVDGNHENFDALEAYPEEIWHGGRIHRIRPNVIHLMRGQVFEIEGRTFITFGGAYSIDVAQRVPGRSWWARESPSDAEYAEARANLAAHGNKVDYILTHTCPTSTIVLMGHTPCVQDLRLTDFLEEVRQTVSYRRWFFGHWHADKPLFDDMRLLWFDTEAVS